PAQMPAPRSQGGSMEYRCCFLHPIGASDVDGIGIPVPDELDGRKVVRPSEIHSADARPVGWEIPLLDGNHPFFDGEDSTRTKDRNAFGSRFEFMGGVAGNDASSLLIAVVRHVINRHCGDVAVV